MSQKANVRLEFNGITDPHLRNELRAWFHRQHSDRFTKEETLLQCIVALSYLNEDRPTIRLLMIVQEFLIMADARQHGREPMRACSYTTMRKRIEDMPRRLVKKARSGRKTGGPSISDTLAHFGVGIPFNDAVGEPAVQDVDAAYGSPIDMICTKPTDHGVVKVHFLVKPRS
ncbi:hypothetical protein [Rhizobium leguminosarum]|uniref:hypothetical protein n=1 Tax=Rhizobium leguminosarum TaxID=384 RepID=UPI00102FB90B|nr:hypothetical protein [Rhizobium leguminosarum]TAV81562.1 hypothetical protein ELI22_33960 [Rhizobium leguminosarum]TAV94168.1 hypothetical protein ELI21_10355 [Rhizobium leguminosarum]TAW35243.1 hypothetical protein ELI23_10395 [Rhizobium leguminosarum]